MSLERYLRIEPLGLSIADRDGELKELPEDFFDAFTHIQWLSIRETDLTSLPVSFGKLDQLKSIELYGTKIKNFPEASALKSLNKLTLNSNSFDLNKEATKLAGTAIEELELQGYRGTSFPSNIALLKNLKKVRIGGYLKKKLTVKEVFDTVAQLPQLEELELDVPILTTDINEDFLKLDFIKKLTGWYWFFKQGTENTPLVIGRTKNVTWGAPIDPILASFRTKYNDNGSALSDHQRDLLFGVLVKNYTALNAILPNTLREILANKKPVNLVLLDKPKGESMKSIKEKLAAYPITVNAANANYNIVVIGAKTELEEAEPYILKNDPLITTDHLKELLIAEADPWLMQKENNSSNNQLLQLLASNQTENYLLAFQIIESGGANRMIQSLLAAIMLSHPENSVSKAAAKLYDKFGSQLFKTHTEKSSSLKRSGHTIGKVNSIVNHQDIDAFAFRLMHHCIAGANKNIADIQPTVLILKDARNVVISECLPFFTHLQELHFDSCEGLQLAPAIPLLKQLTSCKVLKLNDCKIAIPASIAELTHLHTLELAFDSVESPESLKALTSLTSLNLEGTKITEWSWLTHLEQLEHLTINNCALPALPSEIASLKKLKILDAKQNRIPEIPEQITGLAQLQSLDFSNNQLNSFPYFLAKLKNLEILLLRSNAIPAFEEAKVRPYLLNTSNLPWSELSLSRNQLESFSFGSINAQSLRVLDISHNNKIKTLDDSIFRYKSLRELYAHHNEIAEVPPSILGCYFDKLWLQHNRITILPDYMAKVSVQNGDFSDNQIAFIHPDFDTIGKSNHGRLYWKIRNNPISGTLGGFGGLYGR